MKTKAHKIVVMLDATSGYIHDYYESFSATAKEYTQMQLATTLKNGKETFVFDGEDTILIVDPDDVVFYVWNRNEQKLFDDYRDFKIPTKNPQLRKIVGYQIINSDGYNIHGEGDDPFGLMSFDVLCDDAVNTAREWVAENEGFKVVPVYYGDIEEPAYVGQVAISTDNSPQFNGTL